ncbi:trypsin-like peptidase domain-containing protein [Thermomicrobiaceae bacterium CFH 74404]|uniref:Trypsin-like peptidase domain-containing protein n=1 Tax=Thermalbibacter longus TaxID=2951981 RepID=A0AA41WER3_9BACT|nr:trypsin-like peptidase domain-containing protein [Thermalbibacter longus]MCM8748738.1 trypsin-like peptidase domain-containing protein [Thermalbibacter longus]
MKRGYSLWVVVLVALLALSFGTVAGGVAGTVAALLVVPRSSPVSMPQPTEVVTVATSTASPSPTVVALPSPTATLAPPAASADEGVSVADIVERVSPAVVTVVNRQALGLGGLFGDENEPAGTGTGFIIDEQGHVITNNHVVEGAQEIEVLFSDGSKASAQLVGADRFSDLAVIKVDPPVPGTLPLGDSDQLRPGDRVIAIGSTLGDFTNTVTEGVVSGLGRQLETPDGFNLENMIQHDASINPGNSGGPLLNLRGEVVGVNTAVVRQAGFLPIEGLGFAIPSNTVKIIADQLIQNGRVIRPYLGITYEPITPRQALAGDLPVDHGVLVTAVEPGSPADQAGARDGDIITALNGQAIDGDHPLVNELFRYRPGDTVTMEVFRPSTGETLTLRVQLGERPADL